MVCITMVLIMTKRIILSPNNSFDLTPTWWKNLVYNTNGSYGISDRDIIMDTYHAKIVRDSNRIIQFIEFEKEEYYTWFLLNINSDPHFQS